MILPVILRLAFIINYEFILINELYFKYYLFFKEVMKFEI